jgi:hypothetical protein
VCEVVLYQCTALATANSMLNISMMHPNGTKKRRHAQLSPGTARGQIAKWRAMQSSPGMPDSNGGCGGNIVMVPMCYSSSLPLPLHSSDQGGDDDGTDNSDSLPSLADHDVASPHCQPDIEHSLSKGMTVILQHAK